MANNRDLVSIVVPIYKVEKYLDECIRSIVNQTYTNLEIILVNDGSPDNCGAMCDAWAAKDSRIKVVHKTNGGLPDARNAGIKVSTGKWIMFVDSDDSISGHMVKALVEANTDGDRLAMSGIVRFSDEVPQENDNNYKVQPCGKNLAAVRGGLYCVSALYSRELITKHDLLFDKSLRNIEDVAWNGIYLCYISEVVYVDVPYFYRINPNSITSKCSDYKWQIVSWIAARRSIMNWFADKPLTESQKKEAVHMFRHCQNNIYAECVAGKVSFSTLRDMEKEETARFDQKLVSVPERMAMNCLPWLYYGLYTMLIRVKNHLHQRNR